jgi:hypothetical protein
MVGIFGIFEIQPVVKALFEYLTPSDILTLSRVCRQFGTLLAIAHSYASFTALTIIQTNYSRIVRLNIDIEYDATPPGRLTDINYCDPSLDFSGFQNLRILTIKGSGVIYILGLPPSLQYFESKISISNIEILNNCKNLRVLIYKPKECEDCIKSLNDQLHLSRKIFPKLRILEFWHPYLIADIFYYRAISRRQQISEYMAGHLRICH